MTKPAHFSLLALVAAASGRYLFFVSDYHAHSRYDPEPEPGTAFLNMIELQEP